MRLDVNILAISKLTIIFGFIFFAGFIHISAYFNEFGFRYSDLSLDYHQVFYRGIVVVTFNKLALIIFILMLLLCFIDHSTYKILFFGKYRDARNYANPIVLLLFISIWPIALNDGFEAAQRDSAPSTTKLLELTSLADKNGAENLLFKELKKSPGIDNVFVVRNSRGRLTVIAPPSDAIAGSIKPAIIHLLLKSGDSYVEKTYSYRG